MSKMKNRYDDEIQEIQIDIPEEKVAKGFDYNSVCPQCKSENFEVEKSYEESETLVYECECYHCGCLFIEVYDLEFRKSIITTKGREHSQSE